MVFFSSVYSKDVKFFSDFVGHDYVVAQSKKILMLLLKVKEVIFKYCTHACYATDAVLQQSLRPAGIETEIKKYYHGTLCSYGYKQKSLFYPAV